MDGKACKYLFFFRSKKVKIKTAYYHLLSSKTGNLYIFCVTKDLVLLLQKF